MHVYTEIFETHMSCTYKYTYIYRYMHMNINIIMLTQAKVQRVQRGQVFLCLTHSLVSVSESSKNHQMNTTQAQNVPLVNVSMNSR